MFKKIVIILALLIIPLSIVAISPVQAGSVSLTNPLQSQGISSLFNSSTYIGKVISRVLGVIGSISLLLLVYGGFLMIMSGGNEAKIKEGKSIITYTAIGLVVIFSAYIILTFFLGALGGNLYDEYYDMPNAGTAIEFPTGSNCPVGCLKDSPCDTQSQDCAWTGCCNSLLDIPSLNQYENIDVTESCTFLGCDPAQACHASASNCREAGCCNNNYCNDIGCNLAGLCSLQNENCAAEGCCIN